MSVSFVSERKPATELLFAARPVMCALRLLSPAEQKRFATAQALGALGELVVRVFENDRGRPEYLITQDALTASSTSLDRLEMQLRLLGVTVPGST